MLIEEFQYVVDDRVFGLGEQVGFREGGFRNTGAWILAAELGDDLVEVLLRAEALPFEYFHDGRDLPHVGDGGFFEGHTLAFGTLIAHLCLCFLNNS